MELRAFENQSEKRTRRIIEIATRDTVYWVNAKTRLEDVFAPSEGDSNRERSFLRYAHFDYTLHRQSSSEAIWAFEFDGPGHTSDPDVIRRDLLKNRICARANLPLLRIEDDLLAAIDGISLLEWLIRRWMIHEKIMPRMIEGRDRAAADYSEQDWGEFKVTDGIFITPPELDVNFLFDLTNPYPPLPKVSLRLLRDYGIREGMSLELGSDNREDSVQCLATEAIWDISTGGPLPDLNSYGLHSRSYCDVQLRRAGQDWLSEPAFEATGEYLARVAYPLFSNQRTLCETDPETREFGVCGPPYGGSLWAAGPMIAWYRALREVEKWAAKNLPRVA
ncbi:DUF2726 domain-containing protein [Streptomyces xiaopingdaonensis]|uniref:DUF2726 domain-containing protein n=1 Tax=Streptomyces xiaopingdaonensis TaxID=1565415 RepID=UPI000996151B|nr:DUF2726 domain-containing protein [Streptomyces xiaopingdaonensis]